MKIDEIDDTSFNFYRKACEHATTALEFYWSIGRSKINSLVSLLETLRTSKIKGDKEHFVNFDVLIHDLKLSINEIEEQFSRIQNHVENARDEKKAYVDADFALVKSEIDIAKQTIVLALQGFVTGGESLPSDPQEAINFLWNNFQTINQKNRYAKEPNYIQAMQSDDEYKKEWYQKNNRHLLSSYHEIFYTIIQMRNLFDHHKTNPFARESFTILGITDVEEPSLGLPKRLINVVDLLASIILEVSGIIRIIQIFIETIKIVEKGGLTKSEPIEPKRLEVGKEYDVNIMENQKGGDGIAKVEGVGMIIFVKDSKPGEKVRIKITRVGLSAAQAEIVERLTIK